MPLRSLLLVIGAAAAIAALSPTVQSATAAPAKFVRCMTTPLSVTSIGEGMWGTSKRTSLTAINDWQSTAAQSVGQAYGNWANALGGTVDCHRHLFKVTCIAIATPCRS